jgi:tRNA nucleotidyltransferase (CCA-adding enzyme)
MHMSAGPCQAPILACQAADLAAVLWGLLAPQRWPVPPASLPPGTALVGGAVRDALLGRLAPRPDLDLVVPGDALALARRLAGQLGGAVVVLDRERSIARLVLHGWTVDLARRMGADLHQDLLRRDFTANAIALELAGNDSPGALLDPSGGQADLAAGTLRAISEANLLEDPLRLLRGVRLACELNLRLEATSLGWIRQHHGRLKTVAGERILAELERLAAAADGGAGLAQVVATNLLGLPAGAEATDRGEDPAGLAELTLARALGQGLSEAEAAWALPLARLASILDGASLDRLKASRRRRQSCLRLRHWRERLEQVGGNPDRLEEQTRFALQRDLEADLPALALLVDPCWSRPALARWRDPADPLFHPRPPIDGDRLQGLVGLSPGRRLGQLLDHLSRQRAFGRLPAAPADNDAETLTMARRWLNDHPDPRHG